MNTPQFNQDLTYVTQTAHNLITGDRCKSHGNAIDQHTLAASFWTTYLAGRGKLREPIEPNEVAMLMDLLKTSRECLGPFNPDNFVDKIGYAALTYGIRADKERLEQVAREAQAAAQKPPMPSAGVNEEKKEPEGK